MDNETQRGYLILADISGYTSYLAGTELSRARDILTELLGLIVERFKPLINIVKLEGDAVFAHVPKSKLLREEMLLEMMESTYLAFRDRVEGIRRRTTCQCNASTNSQSLVSNYYLPLTNSHNRFEFRGISKISKSTSYNASSRA